MDALEQLRATLSTLPVPVIAEPSPTHCSECGYSLAPWRVVIVRFGLEWRLCFSCYWRGRDLGWWK